MSTSGEFDKVTSFGKYSAQSVIDALGISENDLAACQAVRFIFKVTADECRNSNIRSTENNRFAAELSIDNLSKRLSNYTLYQSFFFPINHPMDHDALITAVICDDNIIRANEPIQDPDDPEVIIMRDDGFDQDILFRASVIFDGAVNNDFYDEETGNVIYETAYLVHLNILQTLGDIADDLQNCDRHELKKILEKDLQEFKPLILTWTPFGIGLKDFIDRLETKIQAVLSPPAPKGAHLSLVPTPPQ